jgi:hypothetical protein
MENNSPAGQVMFIEIPTVGTGSHTSLAGGTHAWRLTGGSVLDQISLTTAAMTFSDDLSYRSDRLFTDRKILDCLVEGLWFFYQGEMP